MDGDQEMLYMSWWGLDALQKMIEFVVGGKQFKTDKQVIANTLQTNTVPLLLHCRHCASWRW